MKTQTYHSTASVPESNIETDAVDLKVNCCGAVSAVSPFYNRCSRKDFYYLYVVRGKLLVEGDSLTAGDVILFAPRYVYSYQSEGETEYLWVHYTGKNALEATKNVFPALNQKVHIGVREEIIYLFKQLFREFIIRDAQFSTLTVCRLQEILALSARFLNESSVPLKSIAYIHQHFTENLEMQQLAAMECMCLTAYRALFKKHTGMSPNAYVLEQRISTACQLLSQSPDSVRDIALKVGYADQYYFCRIFKKKTGVSPLRYRQVQKI